MAENDQLKRDIEDIFNDIKDPIRKMQERIWFRNILYYMGEQYIDWIISEQTFRRRQMNPLQPTPVANIVRDFVRAKKALYLTWCHNRTRFGKGGKMYDIKSRPSRFLYQAGLLEK